MKKFGILICILILIAGALPSSADDLLHETVLIDPTYRADLGNATHPIMLWFLHNQSLDDPDLVMNTKIAVNSGNGSFNLNLKFEKTIVFKYSGATSITTISFHMETPDVKSGDIIELSLMWNSVLNRSRLSYSNYSQPGQVHYFETFLIWVEEPGFWNSHVELDVSLWTSINSSKVNAMDPVYLNHSVYRQNNSLSLGSTFASAILIAMLVIWRRLK